MNTVKRIAMTLGGIVMLALLLAVAMPKAAHAIVSTLVTVANTSSNPVPIRDSTGNYLTLVFNGVNAYDQVNPDGSTTAFSIPAGQQFVITDVDWTVVCASAPFGGATCQNSSGDGVILTLGANGAGFGYIRQAAYLSDLYALVASRSDTLKSGYVVSQLPQPQFIFNTSGPGVTILTVTLRGYLVPAPAPTQ